MSGIFAFGLIVLCIVLPFSLPPAIMERSWKRFFIATFQVFVGIMLPVATFLFSAILVPEWKGECVHGWLDCYHEGKLLLTPLVVWACSAFYSTQILRSEGRVKSWAVLGVFTGAVVSGICLVVGFIIGPDIGFMGCDPLWWWMLVPLYTFVWYFALFLRSAKTSALNKLHYIFTLLGSLPFWIASIIVSYRTYLDLADSKPCSDCFVVTAAMNGHGDLVGPFTKTRRKNEIRQVNQQLLTFWKLEEIWKKKAPRSHRGFRTVYNQVGPSIAKRMGNAFVADIVFILLKPFEWVASIVLSLYKGKR